jgi:hypothetical protein
MPAISCPSCGKTLSVGEQYAGKKVRCPSCQGVLTVPSLTAPTAASEEVMPVPPRPARPAMPPVPPPREEPHVAPPPSRRPPAYDDDRPRRPPPPRDDDYPDPRRRRRPAVEWAPCPSCGSDDATKLGWTWWGGWLGPAIINCVRCHRCGTNYNGVHGDYNGGRIAIYVIISAVLSVIVIGAIIAVSAMNS